MTTSPRLRSIIALCASCLLLATGCASTTTGEGSGSGSPLPVVSTPTGPPSTTPSEPPSTSPSEPPSSVTTSASSSSSSGSCSGDYCDDFSSPSSGWDVTNEQHFYSQYDEKYLGGTFRMGERHNSVLTVPAPYDITQAAPDYSVQVDVQMYLGNTSPRNAIYGLSCWNHKSRSGETSAFLFYITRSSLQIALWDNVDGTEHILKKKSVRNFLQPAPKPNSVRIVCLQRSSGGGTDAVLGVSVNGQVLTDVYPKSTKSFDWDTGDRVALAVGLTGADVFYDNFVLTGKCQGSLC